MTHLPPSSRPMSGDEVERVRLASRTTTAPDHLRQLATDPSVTVRAALAMNNALLPDIDGVLVDDADQRVRALLGSKLAKLLPGLDAPHREEARAHVHRTLHLLAHDAAQRVRATLSDALATMPQAPHDVILTLAADDVACVSEPVLRMSPVLTNTDLLDLLASPPGPGTAEAIASRASLAAVVADAIAERADSAAIHTLLRNRSAQLQEATLDALAGRADEHPEWHEPLLQRPFLPSRALQRLVRIVADNLLDTLGRRPDLSATVMEELRLRLGQVLDPQMLDSATQADEERSIERARHLLAAGRLTEGAVLEAAQAGRVADVAAMLAVASETGIEAVHSAVAMRSPKAIATLVWKAGWSVRVAGIIQSLLSDLQPGQDVPQTPDGGFALATNELKWRAEMLRDQAAAG